MPSRDALVHFQDVIESICHIDEFLEGVDYEAYRADRKTRSAVERELQIITEAAIRLGSRAEILSPGLTGKASAEWGMSCGTSITA